MSLLEDEAKKGQGNLEPSDYKVDGTLTNTSAEVSLVVGAASRAENFITSKQYALLWRDSDLNTMGSLLGN